MTRMYPGLLSTPSYYDAQRRQGLFPLFHGYVGSKKKKVNSLKKHKIKQIAKVVILNSWFK